MGIGGQECGLRERGKRKRKKGAGSRGCERGVE